MWSFNLRISSFAELNSCYLKQHYWYHDCCKQVVLKPTCNESSCMCWWGMAIVLFSNRDANGTPLENPTLSGEFNVPEGTIEFAETELGKESGSLRPRKEGQTLLFPTWNQIQSEFIQSWSPVIFLTFTFRSLVMRLSLLCSNAWWMAEADGLFPTCFNEVSMSSSSESS